MKKSAPTAVSKSIFEIDVDFFKRHGFKYILSDLDNTLDSYKTTTPSLRVLELVRKLKEENITLIIVSNNSEERVSKYSSGEIKYLSRAGKPFKKKIESFLKDSNISKEEVLLIGDQLFTDIKVANKLGIKSILVDELTNKNQFISLFNKTRQKIAIKRLKKKNMLRNWKEDAIWQN